MAQINVKIDDDVKKQADLVLSELGLSMSAAINIYLKKIGKEYRIPFELNVDPFYSEKNLAYLEKSYEDYKKGKLELVNHDIIEDFDED
ncbi:type II toxin-antitoxin system RelB/DinJ family antitoxin [uncultured Anaerococcus sp.]|uniref:type II toxin-antitoxin system RelB/DinJ family antitoxin n=1 Tax=uncultured Anaerococcus sp. TaxID=293428 RepID=UPI0028897329|nr:type II toxin-antitoxin system RelB/DinJ family antitoxin [uncultured Anaerococcus sp.]